MAKQKGPVEVKFKFKEPLLEPFNTNFYASVVVTFLSGSINQITIKSSPENLLKIKNVIITQTAGEVISQFIYQDTITIQFLNNNLTDKKIFYVDIRLLDNTFYPKIKVVIHDPRQTRSARFFFSYLYPLILEPESASSYATSETGVLTLPPEFTENVETSSTITGGVLRLPLFAINAPTETLKSFSTILSGNLQTILITNTMQADSTTSTATVLSGSLVDTLIINTMANEGINSTATITGGSLI